MDFEKVNKRIKNIYSKELILVKTVAYSFNSVYLSLEQTVVLVNIISEEINNNIVNEKCIRLVR